MKFLVAVCFLAIANAKPSHVHHDVVLPHYGVENLGYSYSTLAHSPVISPVVAYDAIPATALVHKTIPSVSYKTEVASSLVGHETTVAHHDNTVNHGGAVVHEVAPALAAVKTVHTAPVFPTLLGYNTLPAVSHSVFTHDATPIVGVEQIATKVEQVNEIAPVVVEAKSAPLVKSAFLEAPIVKSEIVSPITKFNSFDSAVVHPSKYTSFVNHDIPLVGYKSAAVVGHPIVKSQIVETPIVQSEIVAPITKISTLDSAVVHPATYTSYVHHQAPFAFRAAVAAPFVAHTAAKVVAHPTTYSVAHHAVDVPYGVVHHGGVIATPGATITKQVGLDKAQFYAQDVIGQASYGHSEAYQHHHAAQDAAGNKVGSFSWLAPNGQVVGSNYVADALGYRVTSNANPIAPLPVADTPEVVAARAAHFAAHAQATRHLV